MQNKSKFIWLYSTVLFTAAFILILMSAIGQSRLSQDIESYKEQLTEQKGLFHGVQRSLSALNLQNEQLQEKLDVENIKNKQLQEEIAVLKEQINIQNAEAYKVKYNIDHLLEAKKHFDNKKYKESALNLSSIYVENLSSMSKEVYDELSAKVFTKAANIYYNEGYNYYKKNNNRQAIEAFELSLQFKDDEYFSDDAMYFLAQSFYKLKELNKAREILIQLQDKYPKSTYMTETINLLKIIDDQN